MELTIPPLFRLPHPLRKLRAHHVDGATTPTGAVSAAMIPKPRTSGERTAEALVRRG